MGREPSGNPFNSLVQLERENGIPATPFINAGALVITDMLVSRSVNAAQSLVDFVRKLASVADISYNTRVARSGDQHFVAQRSDGALHEELRQPAQQGWAKCCTPIATTAPSR